jgi:hypothetical protein
MCLYFGGIDFLGLIISLSCGSFFCAYISVLRLVVRERRVFLFTFRVDVSFLSFSFFFFSLSHVGGLY